MIRRNFKFDDGIANWLLISQVAHERISGELTRAWREPFLSEVADAISHHDDGWARWESAPQLDLAIGQPLSFLERPIADALAIWSDSIAAARRLGPLAGAISRDTSSACRVAPSMHRRHWRWNGSKICLASGLAGSMNGSRATHRIRSTSPNAASECCSSPTY